MTSLPRVLLVLGVPASSGAPLAAVLSSSASIPTGRARPSLLLTSSWLRLAVGTAVPARAAWLPCLLSFLRVLSTLTFYSCGCRVDSNNFAFSP